MHLLGIDNIFFQVRDVEKAISFYQNLSFQLKFRIPQIPAWFKNRAKWVTVAWRDRSPFFVFKGRH